MVLLLVGFGLVFLLFCLRSVFVVLLWWLWFDCDCFDRGASSVCV